MNILVIDDDPSMTELLRILLEAVSSKVWTANTGVEGIEIAKSNPIDVIILDIMMSEMDGWQVCNAVRDFSSVPISILTALERPGMVAAALDAGANDYLIKLVTSNVLISHLKKLIR